MAKMKKLHLMEKRSVDLIPPGTSRQVEPQTQNNGFILYTDRRDRRVSNQTLLQVPQEKAEKKKNIVQENS